MKILIVDDHKKDRYMLEVLLRGQGYEVVTATDGVEALEKALHDYFDMIIADILMPRMDGFQLCRKVKTNEKLKKIAFVFYTATYTDPKDEEFALSLGAEKFIVKPTEPDIFIEILKEVIRSHETEALVAPKPPVEEEAVYLKEYNARLIKKLEDKVLQLESVNKVLRGSEKKYKDLIDNANDVVIIIEPTGYFSFVNPKFYEMTSYSKEEVKKLHFGKLVHSDDLAMATENFKRVLAGGEIPKNYEFRVLTKSGEVVYAELNATPAEKEGKIVRIQAIVRDITERKRAEDALLESEERYRQLVTTTSDAVIVFDANTRKILEVNKACEKLYGYNKDEFLNLRINDITAEPEKTDDSISKTLEGRLERIPLRYHKKKDGTVFPVEISTGSFWIKGQKLLCGIIRDITERKKAEQKLQDAYQKLKDTQEQLIQTGKMTAMGQLAAGISHELNQPLTGVKGFAQTILMDLEKDNPIRKDVERIVKQSDRMDKIIKHVRLFARKSEFEMKEIDISQPVEDALSLLTEQLKVHNIRVKKFLSRKLPKTHGDPNQLEQVFLNFLTNARDAINSLKRREGGEITITTALSNDKKHIEIIFKDTGCGIHKKDLKHIFNPFYTTKSSNGGVGLGLSIVYRIIENHKGSIEVDSEKGKGTTFKIILPVI